MSTKSREYPERPLLGVGGVISKDDRVLLVLRGNAPGMGEWSIPGGLVRTGEGMTDAVERELKEELGIDVDVGPAVMVAERIETDEAGEVRYHMVIVDHLVTSFRGKPKASSDAAEVRWCTLDEAKALGVASGVRGVMKTALGV